MGNFFEDYYKFITTQFPPSICQKIINGFSKKRWTTFRVNTLKKNVEDVLENLKTNKIEFKKASFFNNAFYFTSFKEIKALKLEEVINGNIYLQSFSSMIPAILMNPKEGEKILDITAAPGSKTSLLAALSNNKAIIYANEKDKIRFERLKYNMNLLGCEVKLLNEKAEKLYLSFNNFFDKVLVDAPCSGEGRIQTAERKTYENWSISEVRKNSNLQKRILESALLTLVDNGLCVYSTCTLNKAENEDVIEELLKKYELQPLEGINLFNNIPDIIISYIKTSKNSIPIYRILPSEFFEGFTIAIFKKIKRYKND